MRSDHVRAAICQTRTHQRPIRRATIRVSPVGLPTGDTVVVENAVRGGGASRGIHLRYGNHFFDCQILDQHDLRTSQLRSKSRGGSIQRAERRTREDVRVCRESQGGNTT